MKQTKQYQDGQLSIIGIHATILSILTAAFTAYSFHVNSVFQEMELEVIEQAERINNIGFYRYYYLPTSEEVSLSQTPNIEEVKNRVIQMMQLLSNHPADSPALERFNLPSNPADRAEKALQLINIIAHRYPFPNGIVITDSGRIMSPASPQPRVFGSIDDVVSWLDDLDEILDPTVFLRVMPDIFLSTEYVKYFEALRDRDKDLLLRQKKDRWLQVMGVMEPEIIFHNFLKGLRTADEIATSTEYLLEKMHRYRQSRVQRISIQWIFGLTACVFIASVIIPMACKRASRIFWIYIPSIYYVVLLFFLFNAINKASIASL